MVGHYFSFGPKKPKDVTKIDDRGERGGGPA
jgi:hypothetical protein